MSNSFSIKKRLITSLNKKTSKINVNDLKELTCTLPNSCFPLSNSIPGINYFCTPVNKHNEDIGLYRLRLYIRGTIFSEPHANCVTFLVIYRLIFEDSVTQNIVRDEITSIPCFTKVYDSGDYPPVYDKWFTLLGTYRKLTYIQVWQTTWPSDMSTVPDYIDIELQSIRNGNSTYECFFLNTTSPTSTLVNVTQYQYLSYNSGSIGNPENDPGDVNIEYSWRGEITATPIEGTYIAFVGAIYNPWHISTFPESFDMQVMCIDFEVRSGIVFTDEPHTIILGVEPGLYLSQQRFLIFLNITY